MLDVGRVLLGLVLLVAGGECLVRGASSLATRMGISPLVVGLTIVSLATSAPELAVTSGAVLRGEPELAIGNVVGSNIANVLLVVGVAAIVAPLSVRRQLVRLDIPFMVVFSIVLLALTLDGGLGTFDAAVLVALLVAHVAVTFVVARRSQDGRTGPQQPSAPAADDEPAPTAAPVALVLLVAGVGMLVLGATLLVEGAVGIATALGVSGLVVGLTVVAIGTSLPELVASVVAVRRGEGEIAVGNAVGSNIANIGLVLGVPAILSPVDLPVPSAAVALDLPLMLASALVLLPVAFSGYRIGRREGGLLLGLYAAYTGYVLLAATEHDALRGFTSVMAAFVLPLVALTVLFAAAREARRSGTSPPGGA